MEINAGDIQKRATDVEGKLDYFPYIHRNRCYFFVNETKEQQITDFEEQILRLFFTDIFGGDASKRTHSPNLFLMHLAIGTSNVTRRYYTDQLNKYVCYTNMKSKNSASASGASLRKQKTMTGKNVTKGKSVKKGKSAKKQIPIRFKCKSSFFYTVFKNEILMSVASYHTHSMCQC